MAQSKRNSVTDRVQPEKIEKEIEEIVKEEVVSLAVAVDRLGILDSNRFYVMKKYWKEENKSLSNWSLFFKKLKLI